MLKPKPMRREVKNMERSVFNCQAKVEKGRRRTNEQWAVNPHGVRVLRNLGAGF